MVLDQERLAQQLSARAGVPVERARTLPGSWYADPEHYALEVERVFRRSWVGVGLADDVRAPGSYVAVSVGAVPVLVVRDESGRLRAFLNACRHRGAALATGSGSARALQCPYHGWVYRLDGSLARAAGVGEPEGFDLARSGLFEVPATTFARQLLVNLDANAPDFDPGPLGSGVDPYQLERLELGHRDRYECASNWKVIVENYSENYHTPFLHSQLPTTGYEYPMREVGPIVFAWDRPLNPRDPSEHALATSAPGEPGWERVGECVAPESFNNGGYVTLFPNVMISMFGGYAAPMRLTPTGPASTVVERDHLWAPEVGEERRAADLAATQEVVAQDLAICEAMQRTYAGGLSAHGVLSTEHERGVAHVHRLLVEALRSPS
jgi:phenylpropionate dioxygenase-like ring-hydroxylating dioxygenase large terminal subunit